MGLACAVGFVAFLVSLPAVRNGLFWDDSVVLSRQVPAMGSVGRAFFPPAGLPQLIPEYYRPVVFLTLLVDRAMWGERVRGFHDTVLLLHALVSAAVFGFVWLVAREGFRGSSASQPGESRRRSSAQGDAVAVHRRAVAALVTALVAGAAFAVHPVHAEAVGWIMGRADVLACLFAVLALIGVVAMRNARDGRSVDGGGSGLPAGRWAGLVLLAACSAVALLSKESAIVLPVLAGIVAWSVSRGRGRTPDDESVGARAPGGRWAIAPVAAVTLGVLVALGLRFAALSRAEAAASAESGARARSLSDLAGALVFGMRRLVCPWPVPAFHTKVPAIGLVGIACAALFVILAFAAVRASRSGRGAALFTGVALLPALVPAMTSVSLSPVADRYLYLPSVGVCWMAAAVVGRRLAAVTVAREPVPGGGRVALTRRTVAVVVAIVLGGWMVAGAVISYRGVAIYKNDEVFWSAAVERSPSDPFLLMKRGQALGQAERFVEAGADLRHALEWGGAELSRSTRTVVLDNLGDIALRQQRFDEARQWLDEAISVGPGYGPAHLHLARLHRSRALAAAARVAGATGPAGGGSGTTSTSLGAGGIDAADQSARSEAAAEWRMASASVEKAISLDPTNTEALLLRADLALDLGDKARARDAIREALRFMPDGYDRKRIEAALRSIGG